MIALQIVGAFGIFFVGTCWGLYQAVRRLAKGNEAQMLALLDEIKGSKI